MNKKIKSLLLISIMGINIGMCSAWPWNKEFKPRKLENPKAQFVYDKLFKNSEEMSFNDPVILKILESKMFPLVFYPSMFALFAKMSENSTGPGSNWLKTHTPTTRNAAIIGGSVGLGAATLLKIFADFDTIFRLDSMNFMKNWKTGEHYEKQTPEKLHSIFDEISKLKRQADKSVDKEKQSIRKIIKRVDKAKKEIVAYLASQKSLA